jgi:endonuclease/exonuclease/phosphatase family metal-dependent hydrolase
MLIEHDLARHYDALRAIPTRKRLHASPLWAEIGPELERVLDAVERDDHADTRRRTALRVVAWNIQRGVHFDALREALLHDPELRTADALLLSEVDLGLGRSANRNVARELANALGMSYAFGVSYLALEDDHLENPAGTPNTLALAGNAILSRVPIRRVENVLLPELRDKYSSSEKRLGRKRAMIAEVETDAGPIVLAQAHLDSTASSAQRAAQLATLIDRAEGFGPRVLIGGDLNTTTYDHSSTFALLRNVMHKLFVTGFDATVANFLTPELRYEVPLFDLLRTRGYAIDGFNDLAQATYEYDLGDPYTLDLVRRSVGGLLARFAVWRLRRWNGVVASRLDWFAGRGITPVAAKVLRPRTADHRRISDHEPIVVDLATTE